MRGLTLTYETIRHRCLKFGQTSANNLRRFSTPGLVRSGLYSRSWVHSRYKVARSLIHGWGPFSLSAIPALRKIGELGEEVIGLREARRRAPHSSRVMIVEFGDGTALDASRGGTELRYVNHSCSPNTYMRVAGRRVEFYFLRRAGAGRNSPAITA